MRESTRAVLGFMRIHSCRRRRRFMTLISVRNTQGDNQEYLRDGFTTTGISHHKVTFRVPAEGLLGSVF